MRKVHNDQPVEIRILTQILGQFQFRVATSMTQSDPGEILWEMIPLKEDFFLVLFFIKEVVSARLNFSALGPKNLLSRGKNQAYRALYYWPGCQNFGVSYPK